MILNSLRGKNKFTHKGTKVDPWLILFVYIIALFGVFAVSVASFDIYSDANNNIFNHIVGSRYGIRQLIFVALSPVILIFIASLPYEFFRKSIYLIYYSSIGLLMLAFIGESIAGINAFISIFWGFTVQPAEFAKITIIIILASMLEDNNDPFSTLKSSVRFMLYVGAPALITIAQGEMGSAIVMAAVVVSMLFTSGMPMKRFITMILLGILFMAGLVIFWSLVTPDSYRLQRIMALVNPEATSDAAKYQVNNSIIAIGAGGLNGIGPFKEGSVAQLDYVPKDWTDFIFSPIGEAFGFIGCVAVIIVYLLIVFRLMYLAKTSQNKFSELVIIGIMAMIVTHVMLNIGMTIGLVPVVGIPLPFLSYGGSNMFTNMIGMGIVLNVTRNIKFTESSYDSRYIERNL